MTAPTEVVSGPGTPLRTLEQRWGVSRNTVRSRADALGVEIVRISSTDTRWPDEWLDLGDALHEHLKAGGKLVDFPGARTDRTVDRSASTVARTDIGKGQLTTVAPEQLVALMQALQPQPQTDPLRRARGLAEAADAGLVLTTDELAELGVKGAADFKDGDLAYGFAFRKHTQRNRVLWTVEREIAQRPVSASTTAIAASTTASTDRRVGFDVAAYLAPAAPVVDVTHQTIGQRLFCTNRIG